MTDLDADIARIAAMRGHDPAAVKAKAAELDHISAKVPPGEIKNLFVGSPDMLAEIDAYDALPPASRQFIRDCKLNVSAIKWREALMRADGREAELIEMVGDHVGQIPSEPKRRASR